MSKKTWLIYALGGGWGHLNRSLALARVAANQYDIKIITNNSYLYRIKIENCQFISISPEKDFQQTKKIVTEIILSTNYHCLIVDTFPCGLGGELKEILPTISQPKVLVHRYLNPKYIQNYQIYKFVASYYDLILIPGENIFSSFTDLSQTYKTEPWLIRNPDELPNLSIATSILKLTPKQAKSPLVIILASGYNSELSVYRQIAVTLERENYTVRCLSATLPPDFSSSVWQFHYPAIECLWLADVVIGGGGYNTVFECSALNIPLVALPHRRLYDCQYTRIITQQQQGYLIILAKNVTEVIKLTQQLLSRTQSKSLKPSKFLNGVTMAREKIRELL